MNKVWQKVLATFGILVLLFFTAATSNALVISNDSSTIGNIIIMNAESSDAAVNGTALLSMLAGLAGSPADRYVIRLGPGTYDVGTATVAMKDYVDIEGSGENVTVITGHPEGAATVTAFGVSIAELRFLTVRNTGGGSLAVAIGDGGGIKITHVSAEAKGSATNHAIENHCPSPPCATVFMQSVFANVEDASSNENIGILTDNNSSVAMIDVIANVSGNVDTDTGTNTNIGIQNSYTSPVMLDVYVMANGGANTYGIRNDNANGQMFNVYAFASGGTSNNIGIMNQNSSAPMMRDVRAEGSGGTDSTGMANTNCTGNTVASSIAAIGHNASNSNIGTLNDGCSFIWISLHASSIPVQNGAYHAGFKSVNASPKIQSSSISAPTAVGNDALCSGGCYGVHNAGTTGVVRIDGSQISTSLTASAAATIKNESGTTTYVGNSKLDGNAVVNAGTIKCVGTYNATYDALLNTCLAP